MNRYCSLTISIVLLITTLLLAGNSAGAQTSTPTVSPTSTVSPTPTITPSPTATPAVTPAASALLAQSAAALHSVHWVHGQGRLQGTSPSGTLDARLTGDCGALKATISKQQLNVSSIQGQVRLRGTSQQNGKRKNVRGRIIAMVSGTSGTIWIHAPGKNWTTQKASGNSAMVDGELVYVCSPLLFSFIPRAQLSRGLKSAHVEQVTLGGVPAWKVTATQRQGTTVDNSTLYLDQKSLYWLRDTEKTRNTSQKSRSQIVMNFSRYGRTVDIKPPKG